MNARSAARLRHGVGPPSAIKAHAEQNQTKHGCLYKKIQPTILGLVYL